MHKVSNSIVDLIGNTPLLAVNRLDTGKCKLFLKLESWNPGGSIKDRPALAMIEQAEKEGLSKGDTIVEATAGNTGIGLALIAAQRGYKCIIVVPDKMAKEKIIHLIALGAEVIVTRSDVKKGHSEYYVDLAKKISKEKKAFYISQFTNKANMQSHVDGTGKEIITQLAGKIDAFVAGVGTAGTIMGVGNVLRTLDRNIELILADPEGSILTPIHQTGNMPATVGSWIAEGIGEDHIPPLIDMDIITQAIPVSDFETIEACRKLLICEGILAGSSSGTLLAASLKYCRNQKVAKNVVTLVCDTGDKYLSKIFNDIWVIRSGVSDNNLVKVSDLLAIKQIKNLVPSVGENYTLSMAFKIMNEYSLRYLPVVDEQGIPIGILTEKILMSAISGESLDSKIGEQNLEYTSVEMNKPLESIENILQENTAVIVTDNSIYKGVLDRMDFIGYISKQKGNTN